MHDCDKAYFVGEDGQSYACTATEGDRKISTDAKDSKCTSTVSEVVYRDTVACEKKVIADDSEVLMDYDPEPNKCSFYVH